MSLITRIVESRDLNLAKYHALEEQSSLLGKLRKEIWQKYGSIAGVGANHRKIRDHWVKTRNFGQLPAKAWKETLRDVLDDISMYEASAKEKVRSTINRRKGLDEAEKIRLYKLLKGDKWVHDPYLSRKMRQHKKHGQTDVKNQIIVEYGVYRQFKGKDGNTWLKIPSLVRGQMLCIPLNSTVTLKGCLRLILNDEKVFVHYTIPHKTFRPCGNEVIGIDKGYTEAFADSKGGFYGTNFGAVLTKETEARDARGKARNKLHQIAKKKPHKAKNIYKFNLGRKKLKTNDRHKKALIRNISFQGAHSIMDKAKEVICEDLSRPMDATKFFGKRYNRRMSSWAKGSLADALETVSKARGSCLRFVNCAYTSQMDSQTHRLEGRRVRDRFYHVSGDVSQADTNAAVNIKHRAGDPEIELYTSYKEVKKILLDRLTANGGVSGTRRNRPSRTPVAHKKLASTESERP